MEQTKPCKYCPRLFTTASGVADHVRRAHRTEAGVTLPFTCPTCDRGHAAKQDLTKHLHHCKSSITTIAHKALCAIDTITDLIINTSYWSLPSNVFTNTPLIRHQDRLKILQLLKEMAQGSALPDDVRHKLVTMVPEPMREALGLDNLKDVAGDYLALIHPTISKSYLEIRKITTYKGDGGGTSHGFGIFALSQIPPGTTLDFVKGLTISLATGYQVFFQAISPNLS